jgi:DNA-binding PadR family transcriptional regulator
MSSIRLFVLGTLAEHGAMHGHQIRAQAQQDRTELWTDVQVGALYGALKRLAGEGLITAVRSERPGSFPERTVYEITEAGRDVLATVHDEALRRVVFRPDPFDLALAQAGRLPDETLGAVIVARRAELAGQESAMRSQYEFADPYLIEAERLVLEHLLARLATEIRWHDELLARLPGIAADFAARRADPRHPSPSEPPSEPPAEEHA